MLTGKEKEEGKEAAQRGSRRREASMINATTSPTDSSDSTTQGHGDTEILGQGRRKVKGDGGDVIV